MSITAINSPADYSKSSFAIIVDDYSTQNVTYVCKAFAGSNSSDPVWQIKKISSASGTVITFADGNSLFDNIADNRASLTYS